MQEASGIGSAHAADGSRTHAGAVHSNARLWSVGQRSETGYVRSENQDRMSWIRANAADVFVVADGMGGHAGGATAASYTVQVMQDELQGLSSLERAGALLEHALQAANAAIYARGQMPSPATAGMGATVVALLAAGERIMLAHVGDSRAYRLDRRGVLHRLTKDHSIVQRMIDAGVLTESEAATHPDASVLERALGQAPRVQVEVSGWLTLQHGDLCMLCSDGLCGYVTDDAIAKAMREGGAPQAIADRLVRIALEHGGEDNVTVQVLRCGEDRGALMRRWAWRSALALAALGAALAAMVWSGWVSIHGGERPGAGAAGKAAPHASSAAETVAAQARAASDLASLQTQITLLQRERQQVVDGYERKLEALYRRRDALNVALASGASKTSAAQADPREASMVEVASAAVAASNPSVRASESRPSSAVHKTTVGPHKPPAKHVRRPPAQAPPNESNAPDATEAPPSGTGNSTGNSADESDIDR